MTVLQYVSITSTYHSAWVTVSAEADDAMIGQQNRIVIFHVGRNRLREGMGARSFIGSKGDRPMNTSCSGIRLPGGTTPATA